MAAYHSSIAALAKDLWKEQAREVVDAERCRDLLRRALQLLTAAPAVTTTPTPTGASLSEDATTSSVDAAKVSLKKSVTACGKTFRLQRRANAADSQVWDELLRLTAQVSTALVSSKPPPPVLAAEQPDASSADGGASGLPPSVSHYSARLKRHGKELYKNPPAMPPAAVTVDGTTAPLPQRDARTGRLTFTGASPSASSTAATAASTGRLQEFRPNVTPEEILRGGAFGGTYFRSIHSAVTNQSYTAAKVLVATLDSSWIAGLDAKRVLTASKYDVTVNKFGVKCGGSLGMWEVRRLDIKSNRSMQLPCGCLILHCSLLLFGPLQSQKTVVGLDQRRRSLRLVPMVLSVLSGPPQYGRRPTDCPLVGRRRAQGSLQESALQQNFGRGRERRRHQQCHHFARHSANALSLGPRHYRGCARPAPKKVEGA